VLQEQAQQRRLATIVAVDVAGYSARAEADQDAAADEIAGLARLIEETCERFGGRLFNSAGDGFMLEFATVTGALEAAEHLAANAGPPVRVGVHLGEVRVAEDGDLLGHGVNVAARIQALAFARTVLVSADVRRAIRGPLADRLQPRGVARLDKMDETLELFVLAPATAPDAQAHPVKANPLWARRGLLAAGAGAAATAGAGALAWRALKPAPKPDPLVAVLPFDNLSPDPQLGYFADGLSEDILDSLLRGGGMRVTSRDSSFTFRGVDKAKAGPALKADYVLDGSVLREGARLRINARLNDVAKRQTLWAQRFDRDVGQQLQLEDEIAGQVAAALRLRFSPKARRAVDPAVYDLYLRGRAATRVHTPESVAKGRELLMAAVQQAPDFPQAWYELANNYFRAGFLQPLAEQEKSSALGLEAAKRARALDPDYGAAYGIDSVLTPAFGRWGEIVAGLERAQALSPHDSDILDWRGHMALATGRIRVGLPWAREAQTLDPLDNFTNNSLAHYLTYAEQFAEAEAAVNRLAALWPKGLGAYWYRLWLLVTARRYAEAAAWLQNDAVKPPDKQPEEYAVLLQAVKAMAGGDETAKREAGLASLKLSGLGMGYASNSLIVLGGLEQWDMTVDLARALFLKSGPVKIDRSVQFVGDSRYARFDQSETTELFHPFLKPLRASGRLNPVFEGVGLADYWRKTGPPDA
jgi:adenylate cyclase